MDWENKNNDEIIIILSEMKENHERLRQELLKGFDAMVQLEEEALKGNSIYIKRING